MARHSKFYAMVVADEDGRTHTYLLKARSLRDAKRQARTWVERVEWCVGLVSVRPDFEPGTARRLLVVAVTTLAVSVPTIAVAMLVGLSLEGNL